jgi:hypothetical protein
MTDSAGSARPDCASIANRKHGAGRCGSRVRGWDSRISRSGISLIKDQLKGTARVTIGTAVWLLAFTLANRAQNARPDFTRLWPLVHTTLGPVTHSVIEVKQSESTIALRAVVPGRSLNYWDEAYSADGRVLTTKVGRQLSERSGHCDGSQLLVQVTGLGNAPWRRSTEQRILSVSKDDSRMRMSIQNLADKRSVHDYATEWERVKQ